MTRKQTALVTVYFPKPLHRLAFTELKRRKCNRAVYSFLSKFRQSNNTEKYSSGRRGVTRNLVGRESVAWVQIPPSPPEKAPTELRVRSGLFPFWRRGCFAKSRSRKAAAWGKRCRRHLSAQVADLAQQIALPRGGKASTFGYFPLPFLAVFLTALFLA